MRVRLAARRLHEIERYDPLRLDEVLQRAKSVAAASNGDVRRRIGHDRLSDDERPGHEQTRRQRKNRRLSRPARPADAPGNALV